MDKLRNEKVLARRQILKIKKRGNEIGWVLLDAKRTRVDGRYGRNRERTETKKTEKIPEAGCNRKQISVESCLP